MATKIIWTYIIKSNQTNWNGFEIPSNKKIAKCIITKETVLNKADPKLVIDETREVEEDMKRISKVKPSQKRKQSA